MRFLLLALLLSGCASHKWTAVMAEREKTSGFGQEGQCVTWAKAMKPKVEGSRLITWTATGIDPFARSARHQVLAYNVGTEVWFADNLNAAPRWVGSVDESYEQWAKQFYAPLRVNICAIVVE